jgi:hypothetical protein
MTFPFPTPGRNYGSVFSGWSLRGFTGGTQSSGTVTYTLSSAGAVAGDLCVCYHVVAATSGTCTLTVPVGFTSDLSNTSATNFRVLISHKVLDAADISGGTIVATNSGGVSPTGRGAILVFQPNATLASTTASGGQTQQTTGNPTLQTITAPAAASIVLGFAAGFGGAPTLSGTLNTNGVSINAPDTIVRATFEIQNSSFTSRTYDMNDTGTNNILSTLKIAGA